MKKRVLLVNEDPAVSRMLFRVLSGEGHQVILAGPQRDSVRAGLRGNLDVVVLDADLQDDNALDLLERLGPADHVPPAILLSDRGQQNHWPRLNIVAIMEKPPDLPRLLQIIENLPASSSPNGRDPEKEGVASSLS
jgi:DNA-binding response OmpR family regulator